jgi:nucleoside phosphorylase
METYEIANVARKKHVPFIAFRTISDHADGKETGEDFDYAAQISAQKALSFIAKL